MQTPSQLIRTAALSVMLLVLIADRSEMRAQATPESTPAKAAVPNEFSQGELLQSYLRVREQLHAAELATVNSRLETEATARAQATAIAAKIDALKSVMSTELEHQQKEALRAAEERERVATADANRRAIWMAVAFGLIGILLMSGCTILLWRGIQHLTQTTLGSAQVAIPPQPAPPVAPVPTNAMELAWLALQNGTSPATESVTASNQRMMSAVSRMERRIVDLERTTVPVSAAPFETTLGSNGPRSTPSYPIDTAGQITALLGKGRALLNANKPGEALACYNEILRTSPNHTEALVKKGSSLERLKLDHEAIECYDRAIQVDRTMALAYLSKGGIFNRLQRFDEAVECYEQALRVEKESKQNGIAHVSVSGEWPTHGAPSA